MELQSIATSDFIMAGTQLLRTYASFRLLICVFFNAAKRSPWIVSLITRINPTTHLPSKSFRHHPVKIFSA
jgi:hypothetical protein